MKAVVFTLGCKVNEVESASIMSALERAGWDVSDKLCPADVYVLNTCAVTGEAERKSRQLVSRARRYNADAHIYVCGCASQKNAAAFTEKGVKFVCGTFGKEAAVAEAVFKDFGGCYNAGLPKQTRTRAFVKIQDGCNNFCSYCVIPYLRGREVSRSPDDIISEISQYPASEIVLNGINISSYNYGGFDLVGLIDKLKYTDKRIRLGSLECGVISENLLKKLKCLPDFAQQFHLSLQSGSNRVLKAMNRRYTREKFLEKCALIYEYFPSAAITTDIIAGFPTESEEDFQQSISIIGEARFARIHAFAFSPREGTAAYKLKDLPADIKNKRLKNLLIAAEAASSRYISEFIGKELDFIAEEYDGEFTVGYTGNYIKIYLPRIVEAGRKYNIKLTKKFKDGAYADFLETATK